MTRPAAARGAHSLTRRTAAPGAARPAATPGAARRTTRPVALAAALALLLAGAACQREPQQPRVITETRFLDELSDAIATLNRTRAAVVRDANALSAAAAALDDVDDVAVTGDRDAVRGRRGPAANAVTKASAAARRLTKDVRAYGRAVAQLANASTTGLDAPQQAALGDVVAAARAEHAQLRGYATVIAAIWPRYEKLDENQRLWLERASNGWYRDQREAAGNYLILRDATTLAKDRRSLAGADRRRLDAAKRLDAEIERARGALAALFG